jgi:predicted DCC family thiol-disulfide oxidoreductase YuxK
MEKKTSDKQIILFDGVCNLCNGAVNFIIDRDPKARFQFTALQSESGQQLLKKHGLPTGEMKSLVLLTDDQVYLRSTAALRIARQLSGLWPLFYASIIIPTPLRNAAYDLVAKYRYKIFGKSESCRYPSPDLKSRFLEA